jgi:hypothetical protein
MILYNCAWIVLVAISVVAGSIARDAAEKIEA